MLPRQDPRVRLHNCGRIFVNHAEVEKPSVLELIDEQVTLVDLRTDLEFERGTIAESINIDFRNKTFIENVSKLDKTEPSYYLKMGKTMELFAIESSISKVMGSETMGFCADEGIQILGGYGFIEEYPMAQIYRDCRIERIWEGTNEINRQIITGYFMKKALMGEIPIRERIAERSAFLKSNEEIAPHSPLSRQMGMVEALKQLVLTVFNEALNEFGQDLKNEQMLGEALADSLMDIYATDSTITRVDQQLASNGQSTVLLQIAQALTAESSLRILNRSLLSLNDIYHGEVPALSHIHI